VVTRVGVEDRAALWYSVLCLLISVCVYESYLYWVQKSSWSIIVFWPCYGQCGWVSDLWHNIACDEYRW